jgi:hypothetical protein
MEHLQRLLTSHSSQCHRCLQLGLARNTSTEITHEFSSGVQQPGTANAAFNKLAGVLAYLCAEVARLCRHVSFCSWSVVSSKRRKGNRHWLQCIMLQFD